LALTISVGRIYTCLSHEIAAREATDALLVGLRKRFTDPSADDIGRASVRHGFGGLVDAAPVQRQYGGSNGAAGTLETRLREDNRPSSLDTLQDRLINWGYAMCGGTLKPPVGRARGISLSGFLDMRNS